MRRWTLVSKWDGEPSGFRFWTRRGAEMGARRWNLAFGSQAAPEVWVPARVAEVAR